MKYRISLRNERHYSSPSTIITRDGLVVWATPAFHWVVGFRIEDVLLWCDAKRVPWVVVDASCHAPGTN